MDNRRSTKVLSIWVVFSVVFFLISCLSDNHESSEKILFLGNSITWAYPAIQLGWPGGWGMAASAKNKDYAHRTVQLLSDMGVHLDMAIAKRYCYCDGPIEENLENIEVIQQFSPDHLVIQLGEHPSADDISSGKMEKQYHRLLTELSKFNPKKIYCLSPWMDNPAPGTRSQIIKKVVTQFSNALYIDTRPIYSDSTSFGDPALFHNAAVLWHPGDLGMERIAQKLAEVIYKSQI